MFKKKKLLVGGIVILAALVYLGYSSFAGAATYYYKVDELFQKGQTIYGQNVKVDGKVVDGSVVRQSAGRLLNFSISDNGSAVTLPVVYQGVVPDTFQVGNEVVVEGALGSDGVFQAKTLLTKCPSKYEPQQPAAPN